MKRKPFTVRLAYRVGKPVTHACIGSTDPGRTNIGDAVVRLADASVVCTDMVKTRNKEIPRLMENRKAFRQASRRGERLARKRLAKKHNTFSGKLGNGRLIPGCEKPTDVKDIINTEARFQNRRRHNNMKDVLSAENIGWLTPTVKQLVQTHLNHVDQLCRMFPITGWCLELNRFAFMRMEDGTICGVDFQNGRMKGYQTVEDYVYALQDGKCAVCGQPMRDAHHVIPRHAAGSDGPDNRVGLCRECHHKVHTGELDIDKAGEKQKYGALSVLNQAIPYILLGLTERFGEENVYTCLGNETKAVRELLRLPKDHDSDAVAVASACLGIEPVSGKEETFAIQQFRRHDRAIVKCRKERTYRQKTGTKPNGKPEYSTVARNRRPREEQNGPALSQWFEKQVEAAGLREAERLRSRLLVKKSTRSYNERGRMLPGMAYRYKGRCYIMTGQLTNGAYYRALLEGGTNFPARKCVVLTQNTGLVYL